MADNDNLTLEEKLAALIAELQANSKSTLNDNTRTAMKTSNNSIAEFSLDNTYLGKKVVDNAMLYDLVEPYNQFLRAVINEHMVISKSAEEMITEIYTMINSGISKDYTNALVGKFGECPKITLGPNSASGSINGPMLEIGIEGEGYKTLIVNDEGRMTLRNIVIPIDQVMSDDTKLSKLLATINNRIDNVIYTMDEMSGSKSYLLNDDNKIDEQFIDLGWFRERFARKQTETLLDAHMDDEFKHLSDGDRSSLAKIPELIEKVNNYSGEDKSYRDALNKLKVDIANIDYANLKTDGQLKADIDKCVTLCNDLLDEHDKIKLKYLPANIGGGTGDLTGILAQITDLDNRMITMEGNHIGNVHVTAEDRALWKGMYQKPAAGVPYGDIDPVAIEQIREGMKVTITKATNAQIDKLFE